MCRRNRYAHALGTTQPSAVVSSPPTSQPPTPAQLLAMVRSMSLSDFRELKHEVKQERRALKAEMKASRRENRGHCCGWGASTRRERRAAKHAATAQLWSDAVVRHGQRQVVQSELEPEGMVEYQTLREGSQVETGVVQVGPPPRYDEVVEKADVKVKA